MKRLVSLLLRVIACIVAVTALPSCDVHEWPVEDYGDVAYLIDLQYDPEMPLYQEVHYSRADYDPMDNDSRASLYTHDVRFIIGAYRAGTVSKKRSGGELPERTFVFTDRGGTVLDRQVKINLPEGEWDLYVWTDYVDGGSTDDKYYVTSDFANIVFPDRSTYSGSNICREAFRGTATVKVVHPYRFMEDETLPDYSVTIPMHRPMARFEFISTDVDEFVKMLASVSSRANSSLDSDSRSLSRSDLEEFRVVFRYSAYMPSTYNIFTDKPTDSWTGMSFESPMDICDDGIVLGFDHVFIEDGPGGANVSAEVYNGAGEMIARTPSIEIPLTRGKYTVVKGEFLTSFSSGGVVVNPGFDGEYNIEIY